MTYQTSDLFNRHHTPDAFARVMKTFARRSYDELAQAYETGEAMTSRASRGPSSVVSRMVSQFIGRGPRKRPVSPDRELSKRRKRAVAGPSEIPGKLCEEFSHGEQASLVVIAKQVMKHGFCDLFIDQIAALAGVHRTTVQNAVRRAQCMELGLLSVQQRRRPGRKSESNIIRIVSEEWLGWLKRRTGFKKPKTTKTPVEKLSPFKSGTAVARAFESENAEGAAHSIHVERWRRVDSEPRQRGRAYG